MSIHESADVQQLYTELRALAGDTRIAIDALVSAWYLEFRHRTSRTYPQWHDPALREIAAALLFGRDARPGCARLGARRAADAIGEAELREELTSLTRVVVTDPTVEVGSATELQAAALAGWQAASAIRQILPPTETRVSDPTQLHRLLGRLVAEGADPEPVVIVVDVGEVGGGRDAGFDLGATLDQVEAAGPGVVGVGWFELAPGARYAAVTRRTRETIQHAAALRGALRVAPELAGTSAYVWIESVPSTPASMAGFVRGLTGTPSTPRAPRRHRPSRARQRHARPIGRGVSAQRHVRRRPLVERWLAPAAALLLVVMAVGTLNLEPVIEEGSPPPGAIPEVALPPAPSIETVIEPPVGGAPGADVRDDDPGASPPEESSAPANPPSAPPSVAIDPTPVAHVEPALPAVPAPGTTSVPAPSTPPTSPTSPTSPTAPIPEPDPEGDPVPGSPPTAGVLARAAAPGPPAHAWANVPDHASPQVIGHPPARGGFTRA